MFIIAEKACVRNVGVLTFVNTANLRIIVFSAAEHLYVNIKNTDRAVKNVKEEIFVTTAYFVIFV